ALMLLGVALFHHHTLQVALAGLTAITIYKLGFTGFKEGAGLPGLAAHMRHEAVALSNLFLLLMGFAVLSRHFEQSRVPEAMPRFLPGDWKGAFVLLVVVAVLSSFLDNIAAHGARSQAGRLRLGLPRLRGGLWRLDDLVRLLGRRGARQSVPGGQVGRPL